MDRSVYGEGDTSPYGVNYNPFRLTKKDTPAPGCKFIFLLSWSWSSGKGGFFLLFCQFLSPTGQARVPFSSFHDASNHEDLPMIHLYNTLTDKHVIESDVTVRTVLFLPVYSLPCAKLLVVKGAAMKLSKIQALMKTQSSFHRGNIFSGKRIEKQKRKRIKKCGMKEFAWWRQWVGWPYWVSDRAKPFKVRFAVPNVGTWGGTEKLTLGKVGGLCSVL